MMSFRLLGAGTLFALTLTVKAGAQEDRRQPRLGRDRDAMQQRFQQRFAEVVRDRVGLDEEQMSKLMELNRRFETKRREIFLRDRDIRNGMREELADGATPNDDRVRKLLDDQLRVQRERVELMEAEQGELSKFLTPTQRARYFGIQEQMKRKVDELRGPPGGAEAPLDSSARQRHRGKKFPRDTMR
ncbi:MAG: hypothetical protein ABI877_11430 [Gemmatimonadaceae bacterium]